MDGRPRAQNIVLMLAIVAVSLNLRPAIAAIGPLTESIRSSTHMGSTGVGLLTMVPVFLMGVGAMSVRSLRRIMSERVGIGLGTLCLTASCLGRIWLDSGLGLFVTAAGTGVGISVIQALAPSFIKRNFVDNTGRAIGLFSTGIVSGATLAAASATALADRFGWQMGLAFWSLPAFVALAIWSFATGNAVSDDQCASGSAAARMAAPAFWRHSRAWSLLVFFGTGTGAFMLVMAWLPPFYVERGLPPKTAGHLLAGLTLIEALTALGLAAFIHHFPDRRGPLVLCLALVMGGLTCLLISPVALAMPAILCLGIGIRILFPLSIIVAVDHIRDPTIAGDFTAFVQGGGYVVASLIPLIAGGLNDLFSDLSQAWMLMTVAIAGLMLLALRYSPASYNAFSQTLLSET
jgi:MFS transporter, CP family, cyanate transporter